MTSLPKRTLDVNGEVLLQLFNTSKFRNGIKTFLKLKIFSMVKFIKLGFSAPFNYLRHAAVFYINLI